MSLSQEVTKVSTLKSSSEIEEVRQREGLSSIGKAWCLTLFVAEEIPATIVIYVALLMFLQMGMALAEATFFSASLFLPWALKSFTRSLVEHVMHPRLLLHTVEILLCGALVLLAYCCNKGVLPVFYSLFSVSLLCSIHSLASQACYERTIHPLYRRFLTPSGQMCSQMAIVFTYGAFIFLVGILQVYSRNIRYSWQVGSYVAAGVFLLFTLFHLAFLTFSNDNSQVEERHCSKNILPSRGDFWRGASLLFLLLLPQGLMFYARVLYLYDVHSNGGLQCTIQEIGFAQGTVGVIAFSLGLLLGRRIVRKTTLRGGSNGGGNSFWLMACSLALSPFVYLLMTIYPPQHLLHLSFCTGMAQLLFGLGLGACRLPLTDISGTRYDALLNQLRIPPLAAVMLLPMAASGYLVSQLGYTNFFLFNTICAFFCLLGIFVLRRP